MEIQVTTRDLFGHSIVTDAKFFFLLCLQKETYAVTSSKIK